MGKKYNNLIETTAGFNYPANQPLDDRTVVQYKNDLGSLHSYEGLTVYVEEDKKLYVKNQQDFKALAYSDDLPEDLIPAIPNVLLSKNDIFTNLTSENAYQEGQIFLIIESDFPDFYINTISTSSTSNVVTSIDALKKSLLDNNFAIVAGISNKYYELRRLEKDLKNSSSDEYKTYVDGKIGDLTEILTALNKYMNEYTGSTN